MRQNDRQLVTAPVNKWRLVGALVFDPKLIGVLLFAIALYVASLWEASIYQKHLMTLLISVVFGAVGSIATHKWIQESGNEIYVLKGQSAIRNLFFLNRELKRIIEYIEIQQCNAKEKDVQHEIYILQNNFIVSKCISLQELSFNSIEEWRDVVPNVGLSESIHERNELNEKIQNLTKEIKKEKSRCKELEEQGEQETCEFQTTLREKEKQLQDLMSQLNRKEQEISSQSTMSSYINRCISPGKTSTINGFALGAAAGSALDFSYCPACGQKILGSTCPYCGNDCS